MGRLIRFLENRTALIVAAVTLVLSAASFGLVYAASVYSGSSAEAEYSDRLLTAAGNIKELAPSLTDEQIAEALMSDVSMVKAKSGESVLGSFGFKAGSGRSSFRLTGTSALPAAAASVGVFVCGVIALFFLGRLIGSINKVTHRAEKKKLCNSHFGDRDLILLCEAVNALTKEYRSALKRLSEEKHFLADYLQDLSHQIKTPAAGLTLNNEIYRTHTLSQEELAGYLERDCLCIERINRLCSESLKLARLEAGAVSYDVRQHPLSVVAEKACAPLYELASVYGTDLSVDISPETRLECDELWLSEAISNLVKNACEHTRGGSVAVTAEEDPFAVTLLISDDGEGIPDEDVPHVFKRFYSKKAENDPASVGIGMAISKRITEDMGGKIYINTVLGKGTEVKIQFLKKI